LDLVATKRSAEPGSQECNSSSDRGTRTAPPLPATPVALTLCGMSGEPLDCLKCPAFCCRTAGYVEVSRNDIRRLAKFLVLTVREFEARHIVERNRKGSKRIKSGFGTCQFLGEDRRCTVYEARPRDCRGYVCWNQEDTTVFNFARFFQMPVAELRKDDV